ncbi:hypothetical protein [Vibrio cholerae]|nr:hypothetical protein [Vibrio cholerae]
MFNSAIGPLDGDTWEGFIQAVFKKKYDSYREIMTSSGDLGINGGVLHEGILIQCYCPEENYDINTLHQKQIDKITGDINKIIQYGGDIAKCFGEHKVSQWLFITPKIAHVGIHTHGQIKALEIKKAGLSFIADDFEVVIDDLGTYIQDIRAIQVLNGSQLSFSSTSGAVITEPELKTEYDDNINEKNKIRSIIKEMYKPSVHDRLNELTKKYYLNGYNILRRIFNESPELYERIAKLVNNFEDEVEVLSSTWESTHQDLIAGVEEKLMARFSKDQYISAIEYEDLISITKHMIARWIAECPMRIEE